MSKFIDLTGQKFGRLTAIAKIGTDKRRCILWLCQCDCGKSTVVSSNSLLCGNTKSCGCLHRERTIAANTKHGCQKNNYPDRIYTVWAHLKSRCYNKNSKYYYNYGGRGITVCDEWLHDFQAFYDWAMANGYRDDLTIDRIDNNKGYSPDNCRWVDRKTQANNTRRNRYLTHKGKTQTLAQWADELKISPHTLWSRLNSGWSVERTFETGVIKK